MKKSNAVFLILTLTVFACAEKQTRTWIDPPPGYESSKRPGQGKNLYYQIEDLQSGKRESFSIPVEQAPENLVLEDHRAKKSGPEGDTSEATQADRAIETGKLQAGPASSGAPTISYLRGIQEVEDLYQKQQFNEALIRIQPLIEQYPTQPKLFAMQGTLYRRIGERRLAQQAYKRAHELDKDDAAIEEAYLRTQDDSTESSGDSL
jgi:tetratricopeptide (TPR) repeat protein